MKNYLFILAVAFGFAQPPATPAENRLESNNKIDRLLSNS